MHPVPAHGPVDGARAARPVFGPRGRQQWEQANRRGLLAVHGFVGAFAGALILVNGTATALNGHAGWLRPLTGGLALTGGALLIAGLSVRRTMRLEVAGLVVLAAWHLTMATGFVVSAVEAGEVTISWPWEVVADMSGVRLYPTVIYVGLFVLVCVHLATLHQVRRSETRSRVRIVRAA